MCEQKSIVETFDELWFTPVNVASQDGAAALAQRTSVIVHIMAQSRETGCGSFEQLLEYVSQNFQLIISICFCC